MNRHVDLSLLAFLVFAGSYGCGAAAANERSISSWVSCNGAADDSAGVAEAFAAARHNAFTLVVDCPVRLKIGIDIERPIFIDTSTTVEFTAAGKFIVDNVFQPAFVIANSDNVTLKNWKVEWEASLPVDKTTHVYAKNGETVKSTSVINAGNPFNDERLTRWLSANRHMVFDDKYGDVNSIWPGATNICALFYILGSSTNTNITGMNISVPASAGGDRFIPTVFAFAAGYRSNLTVTKRTPLTSAYVAVPHDLYFSNVVLDGTYMGFVGGLQDAIFEHIVSRRYGDLQDARGGYVGGVKKWFAPPHLFYLNYDTAGDPKLFNTNVQITNVLDEGPRIGTARDHGGVDSSSGFATSLKIGCVDCIVDSYKSSRPDGFIDVLPSNNLTVSNVVASYSSAFLHNVYPGWRFPGDGYKKLTFENISLKDVASYTSPAPIASATRPSNENITFVNVKVDMNRFVGQPKASIADFYGHGNDIALVYSYAKDASRLASLQKDQAVATLRAAPVTLRVGHSTVLTWTSRDSSSCSASGAWTGALALNGSRSVTYSSAGTYDYHLACRNSSSSSNTTLAVVVTK
ncbi:MAG: hypothetical protein M3N97_07595 [Pseudomonadota bacterium]|nr:hypothetical protein [Pseudomonadota bacterium]